MEGLVGERFQIALRLILGRSQLGVKRAQDQLQAGQRIRVHVLLAFRRQVHLDGAKDPQR